MTETDRTKSPLDAFENYRVHEHTGCSVVVGTAEGHFDGTPNGNCTTSCHEPVVTSHRVSEKGAKSDYKSACEPEFETGCTYAVCTLGVDGDRGKTECACAHGGDNCDYHGSKSKRKRR